MNFEKRTEVENSCGATLNGQHWIIGGYKKKRQVNHLRKSHSNIETVIKISRIDGCNVKRVGTLEFDFKTGACNTYQFEMEKILFCFGPSPDRECYL